MSDSAYEDGRPANWKRTDREHEIDLVLISEFYLRGYTSIQIADMLAQRRPYALSPKTIRSDIAELRKRWLSQQLVNFNEAQAKELERLDALIEEGWAAWRRSQEDAMKEVIEEIDDLQAGVLAGEMASGEEQAGEGKTNYRYSRNRKVSSRSGRDGSQGFMKIIMECIKMRSEILGLFAPDRLIVDWREQAAKMGIDQVAQQQFESMVNQFTEAMKENGDSE